VKIVHVYSADPSYEVVADQAAADRDRLSAPRIAIGNPADGSTVASPALTVAGSASDPGGSIASVKVNGEPAAVAPDGTFSKALTLSEGENTISAVARDGAGNESTVSVKVTYAPATPTQDPAGGAAADKVTPVLGLTTGKVRLAALLKKGLPVKASCSEACSFRVAITVDRRTAKRIGLTAAALGTKASGLTGSGSKRITVKLSRKAKSKLAHVTRIRLKVTLAATDAAGNAARTTKVVTVRR
jgi:glucodextranase-like protein